MKEIARVLFGIVVLSILSFPAAIPYIVKDLTHSIFLGIITIILSIIIYFIFFKFFYKKFNELLWRSIFVQWLINDGPELSSMLKNKEYYQQKYLLKICVDFLDSTINDIKKNDPSLSHAADDVRKIAVDEILDLPRIDPEIYKGKHRDRMVYQLLEKACREKLISGRLHMGPGILRPDGSEYLALWEVIAQKYALVEETFPERIGSLREEMREGISLAG